MIEKYFDPVSSPPASDTSFEENTWRHHIRKFEESFPDLDHSGVALFTVFENKEEADNLREDIYKLQRWEASTPIVDLGNFNPAEQEDAFEALSEIIAFLYEKGVFPLVLGADHALTYGLYKAHVKLPQQVNIAVIDERIDAGRGEETINNSNFLRNILFEEPQKVLNFCHLGYQSYFVPPELLVELEEKFFDSYRLGALRDAVTEIEPIVRDANLLSFDMNALRQADAPAHIQASPNGLYAEEACQITRYAGLSDNLQCFGIFGYYADHDWHDQTAQLIAQMLWYFVDGFQHRQDEQPGAGKKYFLKFNIDIEDEAYKLVFWKSNRSGRWWMEVPFPHRAGEKATSHLMPCSYYDYKRACEGELPERWLKTYQRLSYFEE